MFFTAMEKGNSFASPARVLIEAWLLPLRYPEPEERKAIYQRCAALAIDSSFPWSVISRYRYTSLFLERLTTDHAAPASLIADLLDLFVKRESDGMVDKLAPRIVRCCMSFLGQDRAVDQRLADIIASFSFTDAHVGAILALDAMVQVSELDNFYRQRRIWPTKLDEFVQSARDRRPDLVQRVLRTIGF